MSCKRLRLHCRFTNMSIARLTIRMHRSQNIQTMPAKSVRITVFWRFMENTMLYIASVGRVSSTINACYHEITEIRLQGLPSESVSRSPVAGRRQKLFSLSKIAVRLIESQSRHPFNKTHPLMHSFIHLQLLP